MKKSYNKELPVRLSSEMKAAVAYFKTQFRRFP
jgi:hypothetical protein